MYQTGLTSYRNENLNLKSLDAYVRIQIFYAVVSKVGDFHTHYTSLDMTHIPSPISREVSVRQLSCPEQGYQLR